MLPIRCQRVFVSKYLKLDDFSFPFAGFHSLFSLTYISIITLNFAVLTFFLRTMNNFHVWNVGECDFITVLIEVYIRIKNENILFDLSKFGWFDPLDHCTYFSRTCKFLLIWWQHIKAVIKSLHFLRDSDFHQIIPNANISFFFVVACKKLSFSFCNSYLHIHRSFSNFRERKFWFGRRTKHFTGSKSPK